jgi:hypothetical protein
MDTELNPRRFVTTEIGKMSKQVGRVGTYEFEISRILHPIVWYLILKAVLPSVSVTLFKYQAL